MLDERIKAIISAAVILIVNIAALCGISLDQGAMINTFIGLASLVVTGYGIWKNHNFTQEAAEAQKYLNELKKEGAK